jgi:hypothetical protein
MKFNVKIKYFGFEVLAAVAMKSFTFWDIMPCSLMEINRHFGGTYCRHHQCQARNQNEAGGTGCT